MFSVSTAPLVTLKMPEKYLFLIILFEVSTYPANGYIAAGIIYTSAVTRDVGRVTRNQFQGIWRPSSGNVDIIPGRRVYCSRN